MNNGAITLAVADDHERFREALCSHLTRMGFRIVVSAANGADLIDQIQACGILPHIAIVDVHMPVMGGIEAIHLLKQRWQQIRVVAISINNDPQMMQSALSNGASRFIVKGGDPDDLLTIINELMDTI